MGVASFIISEGWKVSTPRSSQRCAPLPVSPTVSTSTSSSTPAKYTHGESACSLREDICATTSITPSAISRRIPWRRTRVMSSPPAL